MPGGDGTGPMGMGSMTGRAAGYCYGSGRYAGMNNRNFGRGWQPGGQRRRNRFFQPGFYGRTGAFPGLPDYQAVDGQNEIDALKDQSRMIENALKDIRKRIEELEIDKKGE